ncbi:MAG: hypothetical protein ACI808_000481 [Paraglaciecola sp.]|jgi:uncharacterized protein (DUF2132 family)
MAYRNNGEIMSESQQNNPLHGITLQQVVENLVEKLGWEKMGQQIKINCFISDPSVKSSLKFLRKTPWAREKVEQLYLSTIKTKSSNSKQEKFVWPDLENKS